MASEDVEQSQSGMEDAGGPGAPTSLHALEVSYPRPIDECCLILVLLGCRWFDEKRYTTDH